jgi:SAM-dependent methyltransferase
MLGMSSRALSFGTVAAAYERFRPDYPDELFGLVAAYAERRLQTALEIGAGTGKATRLFAGHGVEVTATEPDAAMLAELRRIALPNVTCIHAAFEDLTPGRTYGLVYAAAALHWTRPERRWSRVAALLEPAGVFAAFGGPMGLADPALEQAVTTARAPFLASDDVPSPDGTAPEQAMQWPGTELEQSEWFTDVQQHIIERHLTMSADDFVGHLSTVSAYLELPEAERTQVFRRIRAVLPDSVDLNADITAHLARRAASRSSPVCVGAVAQLRLVSR